MEPTLGKTVKPKKAAEELAIFQRVLLPAERVVFYAACSNWGVDRIAVTNYRLAAGIRSDIRKSYWYDDPFTADRKRGGLIIDTGATEGAFTFKMLKDDVEPLLKHLQPARDAADLRELFAARASAQKLKADRARTTAEERAAVARSSEWADAIVIGGPIKPKPTRAIQRMSEPGDRPWLIIQTLMGGVLVAWDDRLAIVKAGGITGFQAGVVAGERSATFYFADITGIEYNAGIVSGVLEVLTASYNGTATNDRHLRATRQWSNVYELSNTLPIQATEHGLAAAHLNDLRRRIAEAKRPQVVGDAAAAPSGDLAAQLSQLAELHRAGALSDDEFAAAKQRLIGG